MATGQLNLRTVKLGDNADTSKNFLIQVPAVADGTLSISRENGTAVATIDAAGKVTFTGAVAAARSPQLLAAYCVFDGSVVGTNAPLSGFGVASVTRVSTGMYEINFTTPFADNAYVLSATADANSTALIAVTYYTLCTAAKAHVRSYTLAAVAGDASRLCVCAFKVGA